MNVHDWLTRVVRERLEAEDEMIETACEKALVSGTMGVLQIRVDGALQMVGPHPLVPYGHMVVAPSLEAFLARAGELPRPEPRVEP